MRAVEEASREFWNDTAHTLPGYLHYNNPSNRPGWVNGSVASSTWYTHLFNWLHDEHGIRTQGYADVDVVHKMKLAEVVDENKAMLFKLKYYGVSRD